MRIVDFHTFPDGSEQRSALLDAAEAIDLGELTTVAATTEDAPIAFAFPDTWSEEEIDARASELADELAEQLGDGTAVRYDLDLDDARAGGSSVSHTE